MTVRKYGVMSGATARAIQRRRRNLSARNEVAKAPPNRHGAKIAVGDSGARKQRRQVTLELPANGSAHRGQHAPSGVSETAQASHNTPLSVSARNRSAQAGQVGQNANSSAAVSHAWGPLPRVMIDIAALSTAIRIGCAMVREMADPEIKVVATNRKATHDFLIHEKLEAGISLVGSEVKSLRDAKATLVDGYVEFRRGEAFLSGITINEYAWANRANHETTRVRKLLLHRHEIEKLAVKTQQRGFTLIPLSIYFKDGRVKVELALVTHKKLHDKRDAKRTADDKREIDRAMKSRRG